MFFKRELVEDILQGPCIDKAQEIARFAMVVLVQFDGSSAVLLTSQQVCLNILFPILFRGRVVCNGPSLCRRATLDSTMGCGISY